jgi:CarD family transcriptional regulator
MAESGKSLQFQVGQQVICPSHGLGTVMSIEKQSFREIENTFYKVFFVKEKLVSYIPIVKIKELGVRKLCSKEVANKVFSVLQKQIKTSRGMWNKREQEYKTKINSGSILFTAEVVRDLFGGIEDPNRSYSERIIFESALYKVVSEVAAVLKQTNEAIETKMFKILSEVYALSNKGN